MSESAEHYPDGKRWHDDASYSGYVRACACGERFMELAELMKHCEEETNGSAK